jgi:hypothetical protein
MPLSPMRLLRIPEPFDHPDFLFEPKLDGFRALAHVRGHLVTPGRAERPAATCTDPVRVNALKRF